MDRWVAGLRRLWASSTTTMAYSLTAASSLKLPAVRSIGFRRLSAARSSNDTSSNGRLCWLRKARHGPSRRVAGATTSTRWRRSKAASRISSPARNVLPSPTSSATSTPLWRSSIRLARHSPSVWKLVSRMVGSPEASASASNSAP